jgi:hypothetical protein
MAHRHRDSLLLLVRRLYATLYAHNVVITPVHIPGVTNILTDCLFRWKPEFWAAAASWTAAHNTDVSVQEWSQ